MAHKKLSRPVKLFGTEMPAAKARKLRAGPLSAVLDSGALRYVRLNDIEVLRAIAFLVRDENWGTFTPEITDLKVRQSRGGFTVSYLARCSDATRALAYEAEISCSAAGTLKFSVSLAPETDFLTNRTGFVVLHPLQGVAGRPVTIEHVDGSRIEGKFPSLINPVQPFRNIRSLKHQVMPGVFATVRMEGDAFEMEDHRNWTDASFKTYVRPLAMPWPYILPKGQPVEQSVTLTFTGKPARSKKAGGAKSVAVALGAATGNLPDIGVGIPAAEAAASLAVADLIRSAGVAHLICQIDGRKHGIGETAGSYRELKERTGARIGLEIVIPGEAAPAAELAPIAADIDANGLVPDFIAVSPAADLKAVLPGSKSKSGAQPEEIYAAARAAFPGVIVGGGMFSYFTELNRKPPPAELLDFVTHTTCPIVHAADDISVMETLEALPYVIQSTKAMIAGRPYHVGPSTIACRDNPYGAAVAGNPHNGRVCLSDMDPRQRGLFGAAWTLGYMAAFCAGGVAALTMAAATGPAGIIYRRGDHVQPWFDGAGAQVYPVFHVIAGLARARGSKRLAAKSAEPSAVAAIAHRSRAGSVLWLANLTGSRKAASVSGIEGPALLHVVDETTFAAVAKDADYLAAGGRKLRKVGSVDLGPYAVARIAAV